MKDNIYYIYRYIRLDTNTPFYVGKGKKKRAFSLKDRNKYFLNIIKSIPYELEFILENLSENQAFIKEIEFIKLYKNAGFCETNFTLGGEGMSGYSPSIETRAKLSISNTGKVFSKERKAKISASKIGKPRSLETINKMSLANKGKPCPMKGKKHTKISIEKMSSSHKGKVASKETKLKMSAVHLLKPNKWQYKKVQCVETNEVFESVTKAANFLGVSPKVMSQIVIKGNRNRKTGLTFKFA